MEVQVRTELHPTEVQDRVEQAVRAFLPGASVSTAGGVVATGSDLEPLRRRIWELKIIDTFRGSCVADGDTLRFRISKQAALADKVALPPARHPLGDLDWTVRVTADDPWDDAEALMWWLCPETEDGRIVGPT